MYSIYKRFLIILVVFLPLSTFSQEFSAYKWHNGFLVTADGDTLRGKLKYDLETNSVQIATREIIKGYSSFKIFYFEIFDEVLENYRQFYSIPYQLRSNYEAPVLFELLFEGGLSLLAREKIVKETATSANPFWASGSYARNTVAYDFFFLDKKGNITFYSGSKNELLDILGKKRTKVKEYIKSNKLKSDQVQDLIRITSFYNSI